MKQGEVGGRVLTAFPLHVLHGVHQPHALGPLIRLQRIHE